MPAQYRNYADWNNDGDFSDPRENITSRSLDGRTPITMRYGRDQVRQLSTIGPGTMGYELNNLSRDYSPDNTSSPLAGQILPGRPVLFQAIWNAVTYTLFTGFLDDFTVKPDRAQRSIDATCLDALGRLRGVTVSTGIYRGIRPGEAIGVILDEAGWPAALRDLDMGASVFPFWWLDGADAYTALLEIVDSEGPPALVTVDTVGRIVFRDRHHRLQRAESLTSQATWRSGGAEPCYSEPTTYDHGFKDIINSISFDVPVRVPASYDPTPIWTAEGPVTAVAGETLQLGISGSSPFIDAILPVDGTDYTAVSGTPTFTLSRTSGQSAVLSIDAGGTNVILDGLQVRGIAIVTVNTVVVTAEDATSIGNYGRRSLPEARVPRWASVADARAITNIMLGQRSDRLATMSVTMSGGVPARLTQQLTRDLSDRVTINDSHTGLAGDCFVEQIAHKVTGGGTDHQTTFGLEKAATQISSVFILGSATNGVLGTNRLGKRGLTDPSTMFVLGSATNGVLGTNILAL